MKNIYVLVAGLLFTTLAIGQSKKTVNPPLERKIPNTFSQYNGTENESRRGDRAFGDVIYYNDFSDATTWVKSAPAPNGWSIDATSKGWYFTSGAAIKSTSGGNYAMLQNGNASTNTPAPVAGGEYILTMKDFVDFTGKQDIDLSFEIRGAKFFDEMFLEYSTDGTNYTVIEDVLAGFADLTASGGSATANPEYLNFSIGKLVANKPQVKFRFRWVGNSTNGITYGWFIDDFSIIEGPASDLGVTFQANADSVNYGSYLNGWSTPYYSKVPRKQLDVMALSAYAYNKGSLTQNNVQVSANIKNSDGYLFFNSSKTVDNLAQGDTVNVDLGLYPLATNGDYVVDFSIESDSADGHMENNLFSVSFEVTDNEYARDYADNISSSKYVAYPSDIYTATQANYELATNFEFGFDDIITSISFMPKSTAGPVEVILYDPNLTALYSEIFVVQSTDLNKWTTVVLTDPYVITAENDIYVSIRNVSGDVNGVEIAAHDNFGNIDKWISSWNNSNVMYLDGQWYGIDMSPLIRCNTYAYANPCDDILVNSDVKNTSCSDSNDGSIALNIIGGSYTYVWNNGVSASSISGLAPGYYTVSISDGTCDKFNSYEVMAAEELGITLTATDDNCGLMSGSVDVAVSDVNAFLVYDWSNGSYDSSIDGLGAGTYTVTISQGSCEYVESAVVNDIPTNLSITAGYTGGTCGNDASVGVTVMVSTASPYTYNWSNGATDALMTGISSGTYDVTVTDGDGCSKSTSVTVATVTNPLMLTISVTQNISTCGASDGEIMAIVTGGSSDYSYMWDDANNSTTATVGGLATYGYAVVVTDNSTNCAITDYILLSDPVSFSASVTSQTEDFCGNGSLDITIFGGTVVQGSSTVAMNWHDVNGMDVTADFTSTGTTSSSTALTAGTYFLGAYDNGCNLIQEYIITEGTAIMVSATTSDVTCFGNSDGSVSLMVTGGESSTYGYMWDNSSTTAAINGLVAGSYDVTVTSGACSMVYSAMVNAGATVSGVASSMDASCNGDGNGSVQVVAAGGTAPYMYAWTGGATSRVVSNLSANAYTVTITDNNGCTSTASTTVEEPIALTLSLGGLTEICPETTTAVNSSPVGGNGGNTFTWSNFQTSANITAGVGTYTLLVKDSKGCSATASTTITEYSGGPIVVTASVLANASTNTTKNGSVTCSATGGDGTYSYVWKKGVVPVIGGTTQTLVNQGIGTYTVIVTDNNGCQGQATATIGITGIEELSNKINYSIYPNPNNGTFTLAFENADNGTYRIFVRNVIGQTVVDRSVNFGGSYTETINMNNVEAGVYFVTVKGSNGERTDRVVVK